MSKQLLEKELERLRVEWKTKPHLRKVTEKQAWFIKRRLAELTDDVLEQAKLIFNDEGR